VAIVALAILALVALWNKTPLETPPTEVKVDSNANARNDCILRHH